MNVIDLTSVAEANYNNNSSSSNDLNIMKDTNLRLLSSYFSENGGFISKLKFRMAFQEDNSLHSSFKSLGGANRSVAEFNSRLDHSIGSCSHSIKLFQNQPSFRSPIEAMGGLENKTLSHRYGCSGFVTSFRCWIIVFRRIDVIMFR